MIKVGNVYEDLTKMTHNCTITFIGKDTVNVLYANGGMFTVVNRAYDVEEFLKNRRLIAEYPTWIDAVNSPEFKEVEDEQ